MNRIATAKVRASFVVALALLVLPLGNAAAIVGGSSLVASYDEAAHAVILSSTGRVVVDHVLDAREVAATYGLNVPFRMDGLGLTISSPVGIFVTEAGRVVAEDGQDGSSVLVNGANLVAVAGAGGRGGDIRLVAPTVDVLGDLVPGDGGHGGLALGGAGADTFGGHGGDGGIALAIEAGLTRILAGGDGGNGGSALSYGDLLRVRSAEDGVTRNVVPEHNVVIRIPKCHELAGLVEIVESVAGFDFCVNIPLPQPVVGPPDEIPSPEGLEGIVALVPGVDGVSVSQCRTDAYGTDGSNGILAGGDGGNAVAEGCEGKKGNNGEDSKSVLSGLDCTPSTPGQRGDNGVLAGNAEAGDGGDSYAMTWRNTAGRGGDALSTGGKGGEGGKGGDGYTTTTGVNSCTGSNGGPGGNGGDGANAFAGHGGTAYHWAPPNFVFWDCGAGGMADSIPGLGGSGGRGGALGGADGPGGNPATKQGDAKNGEPCGA